MSARRALFTLSPPSRPTPPRPTPPARPPPEPSPSPPPAPPFNAEADFSVLCVISAQYSTARAATAAAAALSAKVRGAAFLAALRDDGMIACSGVTLVSVTVYDQPGLAPAPAPAETPVTVTIDYGIALGLAIPLGLLFLVCGTLCCFIYRRHEARVTKFYADAAAAEEAAAGGYRTGTRLEDGPSLVGRRVRVVAMTADAVLNGVTGVAASFDSQEAGSCIVLLDEPIPELRSRSGNAQGDGAGTAEQLLVRRDVSSLRVPLPHLELATKVDDNETAALPTTRPPQ